MLIFNLVQRSPEWHEFRASGIGASEAAAVLGCSPFMTAYEAWLSKLGLLPPVEINPAIQRGIDFEEEALAAYNAKTGNDLFPACGKSETYPFLNASFDGISNEGDLIVEIKIPGEKSHALAAMGIVPPHYMVQMQQQMLVAEVDVCHYWSYIPGQGGHLVVVQRNPAFEGQYVPKAQEFWACVQNNTPPGGDEWMQAALRWRLSKSLLDEAKEQETNAKARLIVLLGDQERANGGGVSVSRSQRVGGINYTELLAKHGITEAEADSFRGESSESVSVRASGKTSLVDARTEQANIVGEYLPEQEVVW